LPLYLVNNFTLDPGFRGQKDIDLFLIFEDIRKSARTSGFRFSADTIFALSDTVMPTERCIKKG
jgi:hypothetical protein